MTCLFKTQRFLQMHCQSRKIYMKKQFVTPFLVVFMLACKKSEVQPIGNTLIGKWVYTASNIGIAGPGQWVPGTPPNQTIEFKSDGSFISTNHFWAETQFQTVDSVTIKFWPNRTVHGYTLLGYVIDTIAGDLLMHPVDPMCIEGCEYKYHRVGID
jgi:hypothetical protein